MVYASELELQSMHIQPAGHILLEKSNSEILGGTTTVSYSGGIASGERIDTEPDPYGGMMTRWRPSLESEGPNFIELGLGCWALTVQTDGPLDDDLRKALTESVIGLETQSGFLILESQPPLRVLGPFPLDGPAPPELYFGDGITLRAGCAPLEGLRTHQQNGLTIHNYEDGYKAWCDAEHKLTVGVYKPEPDDIIIDKTVRADELIEKLEFRKVELED